MHLKNISDMFVCQRWELAIKFGVRNSDALVLLMQNNKKKVDNIDDDNGEIDPKVRAKREK